MGWRNINLQHTIHFRLDLPYSSINKIWINPAEYLLLFIIIIAVFHFLYDRKTWSLKLGLMVYFYCPQVSV
jgi:hypothetical protein